MLSALHVMVDVSSFPSEFDCVITPHLADGFHAEFKNSSAEIDDSPRLQTPLWLDDKAIVEDSIAKDNNLNGRRVLTFYIET